MRLRIEYDSDIKQDVLYLDHFPVSAGAPRYLFAGYADPPAAWLAYVYVSGKLQANGNSARKTLAYLEKQTHELRKLHIQLN